MGKKHQAAHLPFTKFSQEAINPPPPNFFFLQIICHLVSLHESMVFRGSPRVRFFNDVLLLSYLFWLTWF